MGILHNLAHDRPGICYNPVVSEETTRGAEVGLTIGGINIAVIGIGADEEAEEALVEAATEALTEQAEEQGFTVETTEEEA